MIDEILKEKIIERKFYSEKLKNYFGSNIIKVITGMRRVGKSYLLKHLIREIFAEGIIPKENFFYINKEDLEFDHIKNYSDLYAEFKNFLENIDKSKKLFIGIDEIQEIESWEKFVNSILANYQKKAEIFITGSNSNMLSSELSTLLTGRFIEIEIFPLSFSEYLNFANEKKSKEIFFEYLRFGGLPGIFGVKKDEKIIFEYLKGIYSTIILKDVVKSFGLRNINFFENLYKYVFANIGSIFSAKNISDYLKSQKVNISSETVLNYLDYGLKVYVLNLVKAQNPETKKFFEIYNKYFVGDLGLRNSLVGFDFKRDIGKVLENYVFLELKRNNYEVKIGKLKNDTEIDFIAEKNGIIKYFQVCYLLGGEETIKREYFPLEKISDNWEKYVLSLDEIDFGISNGIKHLNILNLEKVL